jgi:hypothetical protein
MLRGTYLSKFVQSLTAAALFGAGAAHADVNDIEKIIKCDGKISLVTKPGANVHGTTHAKNAASKNARSFGNDKTLLIDPIRSPFMHFAQSLSKGKPRIAPAMLLSTKKRTKSHVVIVGDPPAGFGKQFDWNRDDGAALLVVFVNAADPLGVCISGVKAFDTIEVTFPSGLASFSKDKGNPLASSIAGLVAVGAKAVSDAYGHPEADPVIDAASQFAKNEFNGTGEATKFRDVYGRDPGSGGWGLAEGGVLVCLPEAGGTLYSGDGDHRERWAGQPRRTTERRSPPKHVGRNGFFLGEKSSNKHTCRKDGDIFILAWDEAYADNAGFYELHVLLTPAPPPPPFGGEIKRAAHGDLPKTGAKKPSPNNELKDR